MERLQQGPHMHMQLQEHIIYGKGKEKNTKEKADQPKAYSPSMAYQLLLV